MNLGQEDQKGKFRRVQNIEFLKEIYRQMILIVCCQNTERKAEERKTQQGGPVLEKADEGTIAPTSRNEQDQATRMPDEEVINHGKTKKGEERVQRNPCPWRSW
ncbi:hypothetical protein TNCV_2780951 [Trichonephila clavipes]|nr:hypothetical protein TNCV_2780951 [Trichonephila clavipes]